MTAISAEQHLYRIVIAPTRDDLDAHGAAVLRDIHEFGMPHVSRLSSARLFFIETATTPDTMAGLCTDLLVDPVTERFECKTLDQNPADPPPADTAEIEVRLKPGIMDPVAGSTLTAMADMGFDTSVIRAATGRLYRITGLRDAAEAELIARRLLANECIEDVYVTGFGRNDPRPDHLPVAPERSFQLRHIPLLGLDNDGLKQLSREAHLFLSISEMKALQEHYRTLGREPTDIELETFAQTWSEHCVHKTLKSAVRYIGEPMPSARDGGAAEVEITYDNLLKDTIARATHELMSSGRADWCLSVFVDNAGVIEFDDEFGIAFKAETHNRPSAIEPYGGAATGVGGVIRDVMGCGLGAKPIANTDVFCVASPDFALASLPKGVLHPRRILKGIVAGVRDYGNRMGIPTVNGAIVFDDRYLGNPLVFCGCVGLIPRKCVEKEPQPNDLVVVIGGRTGLDGIHGATFSSSELTDTHADEFAHAVQIGNAITEKQVLDAQLQARDHADGCLYTAITDCGAGGLSSAVGEMGEKLGASVELDRVPLKYAGLRYDEIWISEAQERMVMAVPPANWEKLEAICRAEGVEATVIGTFRDDGQLVLNYNGQTVGEIDADFLHNGIPSTQKQATWKPSPEPPQAQRDRFPKARLGFADWKNMLGKSWKPGTRFRDELLFRLRQLNTTSKEWVIRQYDHEVQGASVIKPLTGPGSGPSDAAVLRPRLDSNRGIAIANGLCPHLSDIDPYWMAVAAIDEAIRNVVCVGGNPDRTAILDNFCWGNCEDPRTMGALVRACQACYDAAIAYGTPFVSGKDSLNNEFALDSADVNKLQYLLPLHNNRIRIPETLLISSLSIIDELNACVTMDLKPSEPDNSTIYFVGLDAKSWSEVSIADAAELHRSVAGWIRSGGVFAAHDTGDEGPLVALAEMAFAGRVGVDACFETPEPFAPVTSGYLLQLDRPHAEVVEDLANRAPGLTVRAIGRIRQDDVFSYQADDKTGCEIHLTELDKAWRAGLHW